MNRINLLYKLDDLLKVCNTCERNGQAYGKPGVCKGCGTYSQILEVGKQLETKKERKPVTQKMILEKESYLKLKGQGKSDAEIAKQFGIKQPTLIYYKKKWEKEASQAAKKAAEATIEKLKQPEPVKAETKQPEVAPIENPQQPETAVVKAPETKPIGEAINEALNEAFAEKSAEYERLIAALRSDLNEAHQQLDEKDEQIRNLENLHDACDDCESEIASLQEEKKKLEQRLIEEMMKKATIDTKLFTERFSALEEENGILRKLVKKWA